MVKVPPLRMMALAVLLSGALGLGQAAAQQQTPPTEADLDRAYEAVLADPTSLDRAFEYAGIAAQLGDFEAAVSALERMLIYNPNLPRVHAELGVLYFRLRSFAAARSYFEQALAFPDLPEAVQTRINSYLAQIEKTQSKHRFAFSVSGGVRYQTNANSAPDGNVLVIDLPATLDPAFQGKADFDVFLSGRMRHHYDFGGQNGDVLETNVSTFVSQQFDVENLDVRYVSADTGPTMLVWTSKGLRIRPFLSGSFLMLSEDPYQSTVGGGIDVTMPLGQQVGLELDVSHRYALYHNSDVRPNASELDGTETEVGIGLRFRPLPYLRFAARTHVRAVDADEDYQTYSEVGVRANVSADFPAPFAIADGNAKWTLSLDASGKTRNYDAPNPIVSATKRRENEVRLDAQLYVPVTNSVGVFGGAGWREVNSNLPNYEIDNFTVMGGVSGRF